MHRWLIALLASMALATSSSLSQPASAAPKAGVQVPHGPVAPQAFKEDWTTIRLDKSGLPLAAIGGPVLSKVEGPGFTRQLVRLQWRVADPIDVYVIRPHGIQRPPVIIYLYDYTSDTDRFRDDGWCKRVTKDGFAAVGFVSALSGQRFHTPRLMKQWFVSELQEALASSTHDVQMVLNYMDSRGDLDMKRVGLFGEGSGGAVAILAAAADPRIDALDVIDPWGAWPEWLETSVQIPEDERPTYLKPEFLLKVSTLDPVTYLTGLKTKSLRVEEIMDDDITPKAARLRMIASIPNPNDLICYEDSLAHQKAYLVNGLSGWLKDSLRNSPSQTSGPPAQEHVSSTH